MLEHAEVSILHAEDLAKSEILNLDTGEFERLQEIIVFLEAHWSASALPLDRVLLARTVAALLARLGIELPFLEASLVAETAAGRGTATLNLSPYGILTQALLNQHLDVFDRLSQTVRRDDFRVFLPREIEGRDHVKEKAPSGVIAL